MLLRKRRSRVVAGTLAAAVVALALAASATALIQGPALWKPWKYTSTQVRGKAWVGGNCGGYISCYFHTTLERSSWSGYRTVDGSKIEMRFGYQYPTGTMLSGTYTYKTHFFANLSQWGTCGIDGICIKYATVTADSEGARLTR
jgi:hypothetical protein